MESWDAIIIGGGLAGSAASIELAKVGKRVLLLEKERQAHDKICGEFISIEAQEALLDLGIDFTSLYAEKITHIRLISRHTEALTRLPFSGMSLSRRVLDEALLIKAEQEGVTIQRGVTVTGLVKKDSTWIVNTNQDYSLSAKAVFLATGKHDLRGYARKPGVENNLIGFKMYFSPTMEQQMQLRHHVDLILFKGGYVGLELVENDIMNMCLVISKQRFANLGKEWNALLQSIIQECPLFEQRIKNAKPLWPKPLAIFGIPYGLVYEDTEAQPNIYHLGDQMAVIPSFCGDGMAIALQTAKLSTTYFLRDQADQYHKIARKMLRPQIRRAMLLSYLIKKSFTRKILIWVCKIIPSLVRFAFNQTRARHYHT